MLFRSGFKGSTNLGETVKIAFVDLGSQNRSHRSVIDKSKKMLYVKQLSLREIKLKRLKKITQKPRACRIVTGVRTTKIHSQVRHVFQLRILHHRCSTRGVSFGLV